MRATDYRYVVTVGTYEANVNAYYTESADRAHVQAERWESLLGVETSSGDIVCVVRILERVGDTWENPRTLQETEY
jgi:hypothetical protein